MINIDLELISELYKSPDFPNELLGGYEISLLQGFTRDVNWGKLSDLQKIEYRKGALVHKQKVKEIVSDLEFDYEKSVIELGYLLIDFLKTTESLYSDLSEINKKTKVEISLFRLRNLLYCELYAINKHMKLENGGHVPFDLVIDPVLKELAGSVFFKEYKLHKIKDLYRKVVNLYNQKPYDKGLSSTNTPV